MTCTVNSRVILNHAASSCYKTPYDLVCSTPRYGSNAVYSVFASRFRERTFDIPPLPRLDEFAENMFGNDKSAYGEDAFECGR